MSNQYEYPVKLFSGKCAADNIPSELDIESKSRPLLITDKKGFTKRKLKSIFSNSEISPIGLIITKPSDKNIFNDKTPSEFLGGLNIDSIICYCSTETFTKLFFSLKEDEKNLKNSIFISWILTGESDSKSLIELCEKEKIGSDKHSQKKIRLSLAIIDPKFLTINQSMKKNLIEESLRLTTHIENYKELHILSKTFAETALLSAAQALITKNKKSKVLAAQACYFALSSIISAQIKDLNKLTELKDLNHQDLRKRIFKDCKKFIPWLNEIEETNIGNFLNFKEAFSWVKQPPFFEFAVKVRSQLGNNALEQIPKELELLGAKRPMLLCTPSIYKRNLCSIFIDKFPSDMEIGVIETEIPQDSDTKRVTELAESYNKNKCDSIIVVGGGTFLDTAKAINILVSNNSLNLEEFSGSFALKKKLKPLITVPTTSGTGSEATIVSVIADIQKKQKLLFLSWFLLPDVAIIDPRMTLTLPLSLTASTGVDALTHSIEAYIGLAKNPGSDRLAWTAVHKIYKNFNKIIENPQDEEARLELATASNLAGFAFSNSMVSMVHTLGHTVGAKTGIPHGDCMAIFLPYGLEYNLHKQKNEICQLLYALDAEAEFKSIEEGALLFIKKIRELMEKLHQATNKRFPRMLKEAKNRDGEQLMQYDQIEAIAKKSLNDGSIFYNPEQLDYEDSLNVLKAAWNGEPLNRDLVLKGHQR